MRIQIAFTSQSPIVLPKYYHHILQGIIYQVLPDREKASLLHHEGYWYGKRNFKPFCFSRLQGAYRIKGKYIQFSSKIHWIITSISSQFIHDIGQSFLRKRYIWFGGQVVRVSEITLLSKPEFKQETIIKALSPITMYSTLQTEDQSKVVHYYDARESKFSSLIHSNLLKKAQAFYNEDWSHMNFSFLPMRGLKTSQMVTIQYKSIRIKGWMGEFCMIGDKQFQQLAYDVGVGGKNGTGFGCIDIKNKK